MNDSAYSVGKVDWCPMRLPFCCYCCCFQTVVSREWRQLSRRPLQSPRLLDRARAAPAAPVVPRLRPPAAFPASARGPCSPAGVPLHSGSAAGSARLRSATRSIRIAVPRVVHALAERSVRARPGGAVGGGAGPSPGSCAAKVERRKFPGAADR